MNGKSVIGAVALMVSLTSSAMVSAQSIAETAVKKSNEVIDAVIEAYGGAKTISGLNIVSMDNISETAAVGQSRKPGPPFDRDKTKGSTYIDYEKKIFVTRAAGTGGGNKFDVGNIINGDEGFNINHLAGFVTPQEQPDFNNASGPFVRVTTPLLVKQLQERRHTSHWLGVAEVDGKPHDVITLVMEVGPGLSLYFDQESRRLNKAERILPPFGVVEYRFRRHKDIGGTSFNTDFELLLNGDHNLDRKLANIKVNKAQADITDLPADALVNEPVGPDAMSTTTLDEGVFLIGANGAYSLFVEMEDSVFAAGATGGVSTRIEELRKSVPEKPIKQALLTHHHSDHVPGAADFVAAEATLLTVAENEGVVRAAAGEKAKIEFVADGHRIADKSQTVIIRNIGPTPHTENLLVVYLPKQGIVFEADHFSLPRNGTLPAPSNNARALAAAVKDWEFDTLVGAHSSATASKKDLLGVAGDKMSMR